MITSSDPTRNSGASRNILNAIPSPREWFLWLKSFAGPARRSRLKGGCSHDWLPHNARLTDKGKGRGRGRGRGRGKARVRGKGSALVESALLVPILLALLIGTTELGRLTYTYYMIQKVLAGLARSLGTQQGVNFCNTGDPIITDSSGVAFDVGGALDLRVLPGMTLGVHAEYATIDAQPYAPEWAAFGVHGALIF